MKDKAASFVWFSDNGKRMKAALKQSDREKKILKEVVRILKQRLHPRKIILFGSRAKGNHAAGADFDFAVDGARPKLEVERKLSDEIEKLAGLYEVDVVYLKDVEDNFRQLVLKTGKVLYER